MEHMYAENDPTQSTVNAEAAKRNAAQTQAAGALLRLLSKGLDTDSARPGNPDSDCAYANFTAWAEAGALTPTRPFNRDGEALRNQLLTGFEVFALKFRASGYSLDGDIARWLATLNRVNMDKYTRESNRGNLYIWAGSGAALQALLTRDAAAVAFEERVWRTAMEGIGDDGSLRSELTRGKRALIYHLFSFSATLVLRDARAALGEAPSPQEQTKLALLAAKIGGWLCDPAPLAVLAGQPQEMPDAGYFSVIAGYGADLLDADWTRCGHWPDPASDGRAGGDTKRAAAVLAKLAAAAR
jgi:poly(beta-D-mannuronate) lyase